MVFETKKTLNLSGSILDLSTPAVMGILNLTPDSFFDGGNYLTENQMLRQTEKMFTDGAQMIDIGGASSKPNADPLSEKEELQRILKPIERLIKAFPAIKISVDTCSSEVARAALEAGVCMVNDISGGDADPQMFDLVAKRSIPYVLMHMRGTPQTMTSFTNYDNLIYEIINILQQKINSLRAMGVVDVVVDPGFGFAKSRDQNYELLRNLSYFNVLNVPILVGISRKSMIYKTIGGTAADALNGTIVLNTIALMNGASILRVHDVKEAVEAVKLYKQTYR